MRSPGPGHRARKRFGQNFLRDPGVIQRIARAVNAQADQHLVEIGPGQGALTEALITSGCRLDAIELDRDLVPLLLASFANYRTFRLHSADALRFDFAALPEHGEALRVVGNLPYNISTPLIFHLLEQQQLISDMHFMLQLEVVNRLAAQPGGKAWGRLSIMAQYWCDVQALFEVPPEAFSPRPKVHSAIVRLVPHPTPPCPAQDVDHLQALLRTVFNQRRKTLRNSLRGLVTDTQFDALAIDPGRRPETLSLEQFVALSNLTCQREQT